MPTIPNVSFIYYKFVITCVSVELEYEVLEIDAHFVWNDNAKSLVFLPPGGFEIGVEVVYDWSREVAFGQKLWKRFTGLETNMKMKADLQKRLRRLILTARMRKK